MSAGGMALWTIDDIRREIQRLTLNKSYQPHDFYRQFTKRLKEIFGDLKVLKGDDRVEEVGLIYANPERAIAKIFEGKNTVLPLLSLQFDSTELDDKRRRPMEAIVEKKYWDRGSQRAVRFMALAPVATNLTYQLNIWGKYIEEVNQLTEQALLKFRPNLPVNITEERVFQAFVKDVAEASQLTAGDREDRIVKRTLRFYVEAYIPSNVFRFTTTGEIEEINYEVYTEMLSTGVLEPLESWDSSYGGPQAAGRVTYTTVATTTNTTTAITAVTTATTTIS